MEHRSFQDMKELAENNWPETSELQEPKKWALEETTAKFW